MGEFEIYSLEQEITGQFTKFNSNSRFENNAKAEVFDCFSHYTLFCSTNTRLICDLQGFINFNLGSTKWLTDPVYHTDMDDLCPKMTDGDLQSDGIGAMMKLHSCNEICKALGLDDD